MVSETRGRVSSARPLFVVGCGRSGTSMTAGVLSKLGLDFGPTIGPGKANPKGFFENENVRSNVTKPLIRRAGGDTSGQVRFPDPSIGDPEQVRQAFFHRMNGANAYKDAKISLMWEVWSRAFPDSLYVIVRRDPRAIAKSCMNTSFMISRHTVEEWEEWANEYIARFTKLMERVEHIEVWPDGTADVFKPVADFAGVEWNQQAVEQFVDPALWNRNA